MASPTYSVEHTMQVWNDQTGERYEIGPDRDALGLVEIRICDPNGKIEYRLTLPKAVWDAMRKYDYRDSEEVQG